jgi:hypothetical protein
MNLKKYIDIVNLSESTREELKQESLNYSRDELAPVLSKQKCSQSKIRKSRRLTWLIQLP